MKRTRLEKLDSEMFRSLTLDECRMTSGGISRKVTGKITFAEADAAISADEVASSADGEVDVEFDF